MVWLPDELWRNIFAFLPWRERFRISGVSREWHSIIERCPPWFWADVPPLGWRRAITVASAQGSCGQLRRLAKFGAVAVAATAAEYWPDPLGLACHYGHLDAARWVVATSAEIASAEIASAGGIASAEIASAEVASAGIAAHVMPPAAADLRAACENGHLAVAVWLADTFSFAACHGR